MADEVRSADDPGAPAADAAMPAPREGADAGLAGLTVRAATPFAKAGLAVARRLGVDRVARRAVEGGVDRALQSRTVERTAVRVLDSALVNRLWDHVLRSEEAQRLVERVAEAPEVRAAITRQGVGLLEDMRRTLRRATRRLDDIAETSARRVLRRAPRPERPIYAGAISRAAALAIDAAVLNFSLVVLSAAVALLVQALSSSDGGAAASVIALGVFAWIGLAAAYLTVFWSLAGRTPGMTFLGLRVLDEQGERLAPRRALIRALTLPLAVISVVLTRRVLTDPARRSFQDRAAGSVVLYADPEIDLDRVDSLAAEAGGPLHFEDRGPDQPLGWRRG